MREEITEAVDNMRTGKAAGADGIIATILEFGGDQLIEALFQYIQLAFELETIPDDWELGLIVPIFNNRGSKTCCGDYRGITLMVVAEKVMAAVLNRRLMA